VRAWGRHIGSGLLACIAVIAGLTGCGKPAKPPRFTPEQVETLPFPPSPANLPEASGGMVLSVGEDTITVDQVVEPYADALRRWAAEGGYDAFRLRARPRLGQVVRDRIIDVLLYRRAQRAAPEQIEDALDKAVELEVQRFVAGYGGDWAEAQKAIAQMGLDWKGYRDYVRRLLLIQSYLSQEIKDETPISHGELLAYYERVKTERFAIPGELQFRIIDIQPDKLTDEQLAGRERKQAALAIAADLYDRIKAGEDFAELAKSVSHGHRASLGGLWRPLTPGSDSLAPPYDVIQHRAEAMQPGSVSPPIEAPGHVFLVKVEKNQPGRIRPFAEVQDVIEKEVRQLKQQAAYTRFVEKILRQAAVSNVDRFVDFCVAQAYRRYAGAAPLGAASRAESSPGRSARAGGGS